MLVSGVSPSFMSLLKASALGLLNPLSVVIVFGVSLTFSILPGTFAFSIVTGPIGLIISKPFLNP